MIYWSNQSEPRPEFYQLGNGRLLAVFDGPALRMLTAVGRPDPSPLLSLYPEQFSPAYALTERIPGTAMLRTKLARGCDPLGRTFDEAAYDALLCDYLLPDRPVLIREIHAIRQVSFRLQTDRHTVIGYRPAYRLGDRQYPCVLLQKDGTQILVLLSGTARYNPDLQTLTAERGNASFAFVFGDSPAAAVRLARSLTNVCDDGVFPSLRTEAEAADRAFLAPLPERVSGTDLALSAAEEAALTLRSLQMPCGCVMNGCHDAVCDLMTQYAAALGFQSLGYPERAEAVARFLIGADPTGRSLPFAFEPDGSPAQRPMSADSVSSLVFAILCVFVWLECPANRVTRTDEEAARTFLFGLAETLCGAVRGASLPHDPNDPRFLYESLPRPIAVQGSADADLLFCHAMEKLRRRYPDLPAEVNRTAGRVRSGFDRRYRADGRFYENDPRRIAHLIYPRFKIGYCDFCDSRHGLLPLERSVGNRYACFACAGRYDLADLPAFDDQTRYETLSPLCLALLTDPPAITAEEAAEALRAYRWASRDGLPWLVSAARHDLLFTADLVLLSLVQKRYPGAVPESEPDPVRLLADSADRTGSFPLYRHPDGDAPLRRRAAETGLCVFALSQRFRSHSSDDQ